MGVPYVPVIGLVGTDLLKRRDDMVVAADPFDGKTLSVVAKALRPDVAVFHAQKADRQGNVSCGYDAEALILAEASRRVIVTAEEIVDRLTEKEAIGRLHSGHTRRRGGARAASARIPAAARGSTGPTRPTWRATSPRRRTMRRSPSTCRRTCSR